MKTRIVTLTHEKELIPFHVFPEKHKGEKLSDLLSDWSRRRKTFYELPGLLQSQNFLKPNDVVLDCGANMGNHTVFWSVICGCKVHSFEAVLETYTILQKNIKSNNCNAVAHNLILGKGGPTKYKPVVNRRTYGETQCIENEEGNISVRLDDIIDDKVRFIKIDTEGHEMDILAGAERIIKSDRPTIWLETHEYLGRYDLKELKDLVQDLGYKNYTQIGYFRERIIFLDFKGPFI